METVSEGIKKLEFGGFEDTVQKIEPEDLQQHASMGIIVNAPLGSLYTLRDYLQQVFGVHLKYKRISSYALYVVDWYGMSQEAQEKLKK